MWDADYGESMIECALSGDRERGLLYERLRMAKIDALDIDAPYIAYDDLVLLAQVIHTEAGSAWLPDGWRMAVGEVVLNRVASDRQPDNITDVIYAKGQFSPVRNGSLQRALDRSSADESCYQAALEALAGAKPVGDKLYFRRVNGRSGQVIGHHVFY